MDQTGVGEPVLEELRNLGVPVEGLTFTVKPKEKLLRPLEILFSSNIHHMYRTTVLRVHKGFLAVKESFGHANPIS